jgi:hypothetical protein
MGYSDDGDSHVSSNWGLGVGWGVGLRGVVERVCKLVGWRKQSAERYGMPLVQVFPPLTSWTMDSGRDPHGTVVVCRPVNSVQQGGVR